MLFIIYFKNVKTQKLILIFFGSFQKDESQFELKTRDGDKYRDGYFLGHKYLKDKVGQRRILGIAYNRFRCQDCERIFHTE